MAKSHGEYISNLRRSGANLMTGPQGMGPLMPYAMSTLGGSPYDDLLEGMIGTMWYSAMAELAGSELDQDPMGGTLVLTSGGFQYWEIIANEYFFTGKSESLSAQVMCCGGGGGGARGNGSAAGLANFWGGGGGGGQVTITDVDITAGMVTCVVGAGGAAQSTAPGSTGAGTSFGVLATASGGYGGGSFETNGGNGASGSGTGGSGGGGAAGNTSPTTFAVGGAAGAAFSNAGGTVSVNNLAGGGGGAGAAAPGGGSTATAADGGDGKEYPVGSGRYYGPGGRGGSSVAGANDGLGTQGKGGAGGRNSSAPTAGTAGAIVVRIPV